MNDLATKEAASAFIIDLKQDDSKSLAIKQLEKILSDPENPDFELEKDTIDYIKGKNFNKKEFIKQVEALDPDLEIEGKTNFLNEHGHKILSFLKSLWISMLPIIDQVMDVLVDLGTSSLKHVLDKHVPENFKDGVK